MSETVDPARCPLCGDPNRCGAAAGSATCWCFGATIDPAALAAIPAAARGRACICPRCARPADVPSPCVDVCELDADGRTCRGCGRTTAEIAGWRSMDDEGRRAVLERLQGRRVS